MTATGIFFLAEFDFSAFSSLGNHFATSAETRFFIFAFAFWLGTDTDPEAICLQGSLDQGFFPAEV